MENHEFSAFKSIFKCLWETMLDTHTDTRMKKTHAVTSKIYNPAGKKVIIVQGKIRNEMFVTGSREKERQGEVGRWLLSLGHQKML